jgi:ureidoglycolate lyase
VLTLVARPLTAAAFDPFGTVIEAPGADGRPINAGTSQRHDLVDDLQLSAAGGRPMLAVFRAQARPFPFSATELECHKLGSQTFIPLTGARFVVLVAPPGAHPDCDHLAAFVSNGRKASSVAGHLASRAAGGRCRRLRRDRAFVANRRLRHRSVAGSGPPRPAVVQC